MKADCAFFTAHKILLKSFAERGSFCFEPDFKFRCCRYRRVNSNRSPSLKKAQLAKCSPISLKQQCPPPPPAIRAPAPNETRQPGRDFAKLSRAKLFCKKMLFISQVLKESYGSLFLSKVYCCWLLEPRIDNSVCSLNCPASIFPFEEEKRKSC